MLAIILLTCCLLPAYHALRLATTMSLKPQVGTANLDWSALGFEYRQTHSFVQLDYKGESSLSSLRLCIVCHHLPSPIDGQWGGIEIKTDPYLRLHIGATSLHYGQACFEGLKAFHCKDGAVRMFRPEENARRLERSCQRLVFRIYCLPK